MVDKVALIIGAGSGIGGAVAAEFASHGYTVCVVRRTDQAKLDELVKKISGDGGSARAYLLDATDDKSVERLVDEIEGQVGPIAFACYNLGANMGVRNIQNTRTDTFEKAFKLGAVGAFLLAKHVSKYMVPRAEGTIVFTSATASVRGNAGHHAHAAAMMARRGVAMSLNHELRSHGIHVCHVIVDGVVDSPDTLGKFFPEAFQSLKAKLDPRQGMLKPVDLAKTYWHLHTQSRTCWTFELDVSPWVENPWFNSPRASL
ncbi:hypothetical protein CYMTET_16048 [Cymbomonas tetramitiformis]|uniref:Uncharacterized protein n=1 Tax=Cymbomonas tetramitiformis TaxID=36881 RepID=A0AAE0L8B0_9CHLO|nr:hypothetical protein CYMTET_16048 [Cymbomonas tetramitiformis]